MRNFGMKPKGPEPMWYDTIDMRNQYNAGFWIGVLTGGLTVGGICLMLGVYLH